MLVKVTSFKQHALVAELSYAQGPFIQSGQLSQSGNWKPLKSHQHVHTIDIHNKEHH